MRPFMSEDLSCESETWRVDTAAWHPFLPSSHSPFRRELRQEGCGGRGTVSGIVCMLYLPVLWELTRCSECPNYPAPSGMFLVGPSLRNGSPSFGALNISSFWAQSLSPRVAVELFRVGLLASSAPRCLLSRPWRAERLRCEGCHS